MKNIIKIDIKIMYLPKAIIQIILNIEIYLILDKILTRQT